MEGSKVKYAMLIASGLIGLMAIIYLTIGFKDAVQFAMFMGSWVIMAVSGWAIVRGIKGFL